jgi:hypothetical protein
MQNAGLLDTCVDEKGSSELSITMRVQALHTYVAHLVQAVVERTAKQQAAASRVAELEFYSKLQQRRLVAAQPSQCTDAASVQKQVQQEGDVGPCVLGQEALSDRSTRKSDAGEPLKGKDLQQGQGRRESDIASERKKWGTSQNQAGQTVSAEGEEVGREGAELRKQDCENLEGEHRGRSQLQERHVERIHMQALAQHCLQRMAMNH